MNNLYDVIMMSILKSNSKFNYQIQLPITNYHLPITK